MKLHWEWVYPVPREALWRYIADTDWVNRHAGLPTISVRMEAQSDGSVRRLAAFRHGPIVAEWEELPTVWRAPEVFEVERRYTRGPLRAFINRTELRAETESRTRVVVDVELEAAGLLAKPLLPLVAAQGRAGAERAFALAARLASRPQSAPAEAHDAATRRYFATLVARGIDESAVDAMERFVAESDDRELVRIRAYEVADRYGVSRKATLRGFLAATNEGLLNLRWDTICPSCRGTPESFDTLADLRSDLHCPACNLAYGPQFDRSVEVTFDAKPLGRGGDVPLFCIASPQRSDHVLAQLVLDRDEVQELELPFAPGSYDVNAIGVDIVPFTANGEEPASEVFGTIEPSTVHFPQTIGTGMVRVRMENDLGREAIVRIENGRWPDTIATAAHVTALQEFRTMFSSEVLAPGLELSVETMAVLFTDLLGSTAMYSRAGDAPAFRIVTDHFARLRPLVETYDGAIVKTIGDAVMAVFGNPAQCLDAALRMDAAVRDIVHEGIPLRLRVGFAVGPCIVMRANDRIDYFGTTVNLAARLEAQSGAGVVTTTRAVAERPEVAKILRESGRAVAHASLHVKGFSAPIDAVCIEGAA